MSLSADTLNELHAARNDGYLPLQHIETYFAFLRKWMAFNRVYSELTTPKEDSKKVIAIADSLQNHWSEIVDLAQLIVSMECIGSKNIENQLLQPEEWPKSATLYLREYFKLTLGVDPTRCRFAACRLEKKGLCDTVQFKNASLNAWHRHEMAALLMLVYQVRCNLVHGDKRLAAEDAQTARDLDLIRVSSQILDRVLEWLIDAP